MWTLLIFKKSGQYKSEHSSKEASFARLKMMYPNPEQMNAYCAADFIDFSFVSEGEDVRGSIVKSEEQDEEE